MAQWLDKEVDSHRITRSVMAVNSTRESRGQGSVVINLSAKVDQRQETKREITQ